jgi:hypothetical protein
MSKKIVAALLIAALALTVTACKEFKGDDTRGGSAIVFKGNK